MGGSLLGWISDIIFFLFIPILLGYLSIKSKVVFSNEVFGYALTVFSIFSALLITSQIAIFGMFQKHNEKINTNEQVNKKAIGTTRQTSLSKRRRDNLKELNSNISYLTLLSCISASVVLAFLAFKLPNSVETFFSIFLYGHFLTSFAMVLKRFHIVFEDEYNQ